MKEQRQSWYVLPDSQFRFILWLILLVSLESILLGWAIYRLLQIPAWFADSRQMGRFLLWFIVLISALVGINFFLGLWLSHLIFGPLKRMQFYFQRLAQGEVPEPLQLRPKDFLQEVISDFNLALEKLRALKKLQGRSGSEP